MNFTLKRLLTILSILFILLSSINLSFAADCDPKKDGAVGCLVMFDFKDAFVEENMIELLFLVFLIVLGTVLVDELIISRTGLFGASKAVSFIVTILIFLSLFYVLFTGYGGVTFRLIMIWLMEVVLIAIGVGVIYKAYTSQPGQTVTANLLKRWVMPAVFLVLLFQGFHSAIIESVDPNTGKATLKQGFKFLEQPPEQETLLWIIQALHFDSLSSFLGYIIFFIAIAYLMVFSYRDGIPGATRKKSQSLRDLLGNLGKDTEEKNRVIEERKRLFNELTEAFKELYAARRE